MSNAFIRPLTEPPAASIAVEAAVARSADFLEALVAAGAIMAHADGEMAGTERRRLMALVRGNAILSVFSHEEIAAEIDAHQANYRLDPEVALLLAREKLVKMAGDRRAGRAILEACRALVPADGVIHPSEIRALADIRAALDLEPLAHPPARPVGMR